MLSWVGGTCTSFSSPTQTQPRPWQPFTDGGKSGSNVDQIGLQIFEKQTNASNKSVSVLNCGTARLELKKQKKQKSQKAKR